MKTKTTNPTKIGENTNTRNFFQKTFILLAILAFSSWGFKARAQTTFTIDVYNTSGCTGWDIEVYDNAPTPNYVTTYTNVSTGLIACYTSTIGYIIVKKTGCSSHTYGSAGSFPFTSNTFSCCVGMRTVTCSGGNGNGSCGSGDTGDITLLVEIKR